MSKRTSYIVTSLCFSVVIASYAIKAARSRAFEARMRPDKVELLDNFPAILTTDAAHRAVGGYSIGDPREKFTPSPLIRESDGGCRFDHLAGVTYRLDDGHVSLIVITGEAILSKLNVNTQADVERLFGPADSRKGGDLVATYEFRQRGLKVIWANKVTAIALTN
jgi:hypothetical protein